MNALASLKAEMRKRGVSRSGLARELRVAKSLVTMWMKRQRRPGLAAADRIETWSAGRIPASSWLTNDERRAA